MNPSRTTGTFLLVLVLLAAPGVQAEWICFAPSPENGIFGGVDCEEPVPTLWPMGYMGYSTIASERCASGVNDFAICWGNVGALTISSSPSDPWQCLGEVPESKLYLWLGCAYSFPFQLFEFGLSGTIEVESLTPVNGFENVGSGDTYVLVSPECFGDPIVVAEINLPTGVPVAEPVADETWGRVKARY